MQICMYIKSSNTYFGLGRLTEWQSGTPWVVNSLSPLNFTIQYSGGDELNGSLLYVHTHIHVHMYVWFCVFHLLCSWMFLWINILWMSQMSGKVLWVKKPFGLATPTCTCTLDVSSNHLHYISVHSHSTVNIVYSENISLFTFLNSTNEKGNEVYVSMHVWMYHIWSEVFME